MTVFESGRPFGASVRGPTGEIATIQGYGQRAELLLLSTTGEPDRPFSAPGTVEATWSPRGDLITFGMGVGATLVDPMTGATAALPDGYPSCWSPWGRWVLMTKGSELSLLDLHPRSGREPRLLALGESHVGPVMGCAWLRHAGVSRGGR